jgi:hypothetical protein
MASMSSYVMGVPARWEIVSAFSGGFGFHANVCTQMTPLSRLWRAGTHVIVEEANVIETRVEQEAVWVVSGKVRRARLVRAKVMVMVTHRACACRKSA